MVRRLASQILQIVVTYGKKPAANSRLRAKPGDASSKYPVGAGLSLNPDLDRAFFPAGSIPHLVLESGAPAVAYSYSAERDARTVFRWRCP